MSVCRRLERCREILTRLAARSDCAEITGYEKIAIGIFCEGLDRAIERYQHEANRVRKYYRGPRG